MGAHVHSDFTFDMFGTSCGVVLCHTPKLRVIGPVVCDI